MRKSSNLLRFAHVNAEKFLELMKTNQNDVSSITFKEIEYKKKQTIMCYSVNTPETNSIVQ